MSLDWLKLAEACLLAVLAAQAAIGLNKFDRWIEARDKAREPEGRKR